VSVLAEAAGVALVVSGAVALAARGPPDDYDWATFRRAQGRLWLLVAGLLAWILAAEGASLASLNHPPVGEFAPSAALTFVAVGLTGIVTGLVIRKTGRGIDPSTRAVLELPKRRALALVVATGVAEELVFRGYLVTRVATLSGSEVAAVAVSAGAFAAVRSARRNRAQIAQVAVLGVVIGAAFAYTGNLLAVVAARVFYDALTTLSTDPEELDGAQS
jgi:membrane protease YdiL (CAAX protease family)